MKHKAKSKKDNHDACLYFVARIFIAAIFAASLFGKVTDFTAQAAWIGSSGYPFPELLLVIAIILELVGVVSLVLGYKMKYGALALIVFTILATGMFHIGAGEEINFLKNLAIIGGLLLLAKAPTGKFALDK